MVPAPASSITPARRSKTRDATRSLNRKPCRGPPLVSRKAPPDRRRGGRHRRRRSGRAGGPGRRPAAPRRRPGRRPGCAVRDRPRASRLTASEKSEPIGMRFVSAQALTPASGISGDGGRLLVRFLKIMPALPVMGAPSVAQETGRTDGQAAAASVAGDLRQRSDVAGEISDASPAAEAGP